VSGRQLSTLPHFFGVSIASTSGFPTSTCKVGDSLSFFPFDDDLIGGRTVPVLVAKTSGVSSVSATGTDLSGHCS
jgi:hypothetical protein